MDEDEEPTFFGFMPTFDRAESTPWRWRFLLIEGLRFTADVAGCVQERLGMISNLVSGALNYEQDRTEFHEQAARELDELMEPKES